MHQTRFLQAAIMALTAVAPSASALADVMVGVVPSDGVVMFVKRFQVSAGTTILGTEFPNNDPRTIFPEVVLIRGGSTALTEGTIVARAENVQEVTGTPGLVRVLWSAPVLALQSENYHVGIRVPAGAGKRGPGDGPAIGAVNTKVSSGSFLASEAEGNLNPLNIDLSVRLLTVGAGKAVVPEPTEVASVPLRTFLEGVSPNPAGGAATIHFGIAPQTEATLSIYDIAGRRVRLLVGERVGPGMYSRTWDGRDDQGRSAAAGIYLVQLRTTDKVLTQKLVLMR